MYSFLTKITLRLLFRVCSIIFCTTGLIYQSSQLLTQYLSGKTYASIKIGRIFNDTLPSITVCSNNFFSASKLSGFDTKLDKLFIEYRELHKLHYTAINTHYDYTHGENLTNIHNKILQYYNYIIMNKTLEISSIFNITQDNYIEGKKFIKVRLNVKFDSLELIKQVPVIHTNKHNFYEYMGSPVESIYYEQVKFDYNRDNGMHRTSSLRQKCFTFFSWLDKLWSDIRIDVDEIIIEIDKVDDPLHFYNSYSFAIHSPNSLPELNAWPDFQHIHGETSIIYMYNQVHIDLLKPNFDTNCFEYDLDYKFANNNMRSDCITHCYQNAKRQKCNTNGITPSFYLLRKDLFIHGDPIKFADDCNSQDNVLDDCMIKCKNDCIFKYYFTQRSSKDQPCNNSQIIIQHSQLPDIKIEHLPEVTFILFVCNLGGLLGMWCGLSVLVLFDAIFKVVFNFVNSTKFTFIQKNNTNNNYNNIQLFMNRPLQNTNRKRINHVNTRYW